jgi:hypothetical protein
MHDLMKSFSIPWYIYVGLGAFLTLLLTKSGFRSEIDSLLAHMLGMRPRKQPKQEEDED